MPLALPHGLMCAMSTYHQGVEKPYHTAEMLPQAGAELGATRGLNHGHYGVRLSGQDVERGTFNHRHAVLYDQATGGRCARVQGAGFRLRSC